MSSKELRMLLRYNLEIEASDRRSWLRSGRNRVSRPVRPDCVICLRRLEVRRLHIQLHCGHQYHEGCLSRWIMQSPTCPLCRATTQFGFQLIAYRF